MNFKKTVLTLAASVVVLATLSNDAQAQSSDATLQVYVWYVEVDRTHLGSGTTTLRFGPYDTYNEALAKKQEVDNWQGGPTVGYSDGTIIRRLNPRWYEAINQVQRNLTPAFPGFSWN